MLYTVYCPKCGRQMEVRSDGKYYCSHCFLSLEWKQVKSKYKNDNINIDFKDSRKIKGDNNE